MSIIAQTPRLIIREYFPEEESLFVDLHKDEQVLRYLPRRSEDEYRKLFALAIQANGNPNGLNRWGIFDAATGDFIGACLLRNPVDAPEKVELGYSIGVKYWGEGIATEMARAVIDYGFNRMGFAMICAVTDPENAASQNVLLKTGMQRNGEVFWYEATLPYFELKNPNLK
ncbi:GNAT family N-acetyltransferase [Mucilaginibacter sp. AW1-3]